MRLRSSGMGRDRRGPDLRSVTVHPTRSHKILNRPLSQELLARDLTRLAYVATDGTPRSIPIAFTYNGAEIVMCTSKNAPKLGAAMQNPAVALTIDTEVHRPRSCTSAGRPNWTSLTGSRTSTCR